jgi:chromosome transmission fidelity protein 8
MSSFVRIRGDDGCADEWCILEFQGELKGDSPGEIIGDLQVGADDKCTMKIGQHMLQGKLVTLPKAFMIVEKPEKVVSNHTEGQEEGTEANTTNTMVIQGLVRKKILFASRPTNT